MMADDRRIFEVPATVREYLTNAAVRTGVDALLKVEIDMLPSDLLASELGDYYAARAAAELSRFDWALSLYELWKAVWTGAIGSEWKAMSPDELLNEEYAITPHACWDEETIYFGHRRGDFTMSTGVAFGQGETLLAFAVERKRGAPLQAFDQFSNHDDWGDEWLVQSFPFSPVNSDFSMSTLEAVAATAVAAANRFVEGN